MSAHKVLAPVAALALAGCDYIAPPDPLAPDPDVISIAIVLVAGETRAQLLVGHPHRLVSDPPPEVGATLIGPGWRAAFTHKTDPKDGCGGGPTFWPMPMVCLNAALPEPIREEVAYGIEGEGPKGKFTGSTMVPAAPRILAPGDTLWLPDSVYSPRIPIRYLAPPEVGTLRPELLATFRERTGTESKWIRVSPRSFDTDSEADTLYAYEPDVSTIEEGSLHLLGIGWQYTRFQRLHRTRFPWPSFGVSGEDVFGYFDGSAKSRPILIIVQEGG